MAKPGEITGIWVDEMAYTDHWTWQLWQCAASGKMQSASFAGFDWHIVPGLSDRAFMTASGFGTETVMYMGLLPTARRGTPVPVDFPHALPALTAVRCDRLSRREHRDHG